MRFKPTRTFAAVAMAFASLATLGAAGAANVSGLRIDQPVQVARDPASLGSRTVEYVVTLTTPSVAKAVKNAGKLTKDQQKAHAQGIKGQQDQVADRVRQLGGKELARVDKALNAIVVSLDSRRKAELEQTDGVQSVRPVNRYELDLSATVPYIGAAAVQAGGNTGAGIRVAVLDSGIDYTHVAMGGAGSAAAYAAAYGTSTADAKNKTLDGVFPTPKVVGGFDFVGEVWPNGDLAPDPDPIDCSPTAIGCGGGHGTHVADIIGGVQSGKFGVAPGVSFYAVKVCSSVATSCSGVALLQAVDFALDPNGDGDISDRVDVINLSLGSSYGQEQDDLTAALNSAADAGVVVVASAGNSADRPYIVGSPSSGKNVISVAQTQVPGALAFPLVVTNIAPPTVINNTATVDWAPVGAGFSGAVARLGRGCPAGSATPPNPVDDPYFNGNNPAGKVALIDRGACSVSLKVDRATKAGAVAVIIANNVSGDPPSFSFGGGDLPMVPTVIISLADGNRIKTGLGATGLNAAVVASMSSANSIALVGSMVASSSRGPSYSFNSIKPDIGAPGGSISALVGTGTGTEAFSGTSGAAPMVAGSAALLLKARPGLSPAEVKSLLMNTAETTIYTNPATQPGVLAPITRIGGGEVRVNSAVASQTAAWEKEDRAGSLSFGYSPLAKQTKLKKKVVVQNYGSDKRTYAITPGFRYANDAASGAVVFNAPASIEVNGGKSREFDVEITVDPSKLPAWNLGLASLQGTGSLLQGVEFDGYLAIDGGTNNTVHLAWQVLPHRAADVSAGPKQVNLKNDGTGTLNLKNKSAVLDGDFEVFALTGQSKEIKKKLLPQPGDNFAVVDIKSVGVRMVPASVVGIDILEFAIDTYGARAHPAYPGGFQIEIDTTGDGVPDYFVFNQENGTFASTGQTLVFVQQAGSPTANAFFFMDADLNSGNAILTVPPAALGLTFGSTFTFSVYAYDNYFTGNITDAIENMTYTGGTPRFASPTFFDTVPAGGEFNLDITAVPGGDVKSPSQTGLLLMYRNAEGKSRKDVGKEEAQAIEVKL